MEKPLSEYPDISDILARKAAGRRQRAALSFAEKLDILDALRERVRPIIQAREFRRQQRANGDNMSLAEVLAQSGDADAEVDPPRIGDGIFKLADLE